MTAVQQIAITENRGRFTASWAQWNGQPRDCCPGGHLTRRDALTCAEQALRYQA